jgi:hypothetical protein
MGVFGSEVDGTNDSHCDTDRIRGANYTCNGDGEADSIHVRLRAAANCNGTIKCALYDHTTNVLVGATEERTVALTPSFAWFEFNFIAPKPTVVNGTVYVLCFWIDYVATDVILAWSGEGGGPAADHYKDTAYGVWPNPIAWNHSVNTQQCLHCHWSVSAPPVTGGVAGGGGFFLDTRYIGERILEKAAKTAIVYGLNWLISIVLDEDS